MTSLLILLTIYLNARHCSSPLHAPVTALESVAAVDLANQLVSQCHHLVITCNEAGSLYHNALKSDNALALLMPTETHDRGFAMTSSISTMMASCLAVFAPDVINSTSFQDVATRCKQIVASQGDFSTAVFGDLPFKRLFTSAVADCKVWRATISPESAGANGR